MSNLQTPKLKFRCDNRTIPVSEESHSPSAYIHTFKLVLLLTTSWNSINRSTMWQEWYLNSLQCQNTWETLYLLRKGKTLILSIIYCPPFWLLFWCWAFLQSNHIRRKKLTEELFASYLKRKAVFVLTYLLRN